MGPDDPFTRAGLSALGFEGFIPFHALDLTKVPTRPGVYVILREDDRRPRFLTTNLGGWFKGKDPTVPVSELEDAWPDGTHCVYIGKATAGSKGTRHLRQRLKELRRFGDGEPVGHQGGKRIWQLSDAETYVLAWREAGPGEDPGDAEGELIHAFVAHHSKRPLGNRTIGRR